MDGNLARPRDAHHADAEHAEPRGRAIAQLAALIRRGGEIQSAPHVDRLSQWQHDCAAAIHQLSGGSKAHWLSRAYSGALLVRRADGAAVVEADARELVERILDVLAQGVAALAGLEEGAAPGAAPSPRYFEFVHDAALRPVLEQAFADSRTAFARGDYGLALVLSCSVIDALLTDALAHARAGGREASADDGEFETRIAAAEQAGLIGRGCARLPAAARRYRDLTDAEGELRAEAKAGERDARIAGQVLRVVMRDLNPGR